jgi:hypothetical protein
MNGVKFEIGKNIDLSSGISFHSSVYLIELMSEKL